MVLTHVPSHSVACSSPRPFCTFAVLNLPTSFLWLLVNKHIFLLLPHREEHQPKTTRLPLPPQRGPYQGLAALLLPSSSPPSSCSGGGPPAPCFPLCLFWIHPPTSVLLLTEPLALSLRFSLILCTCLRVYPKLFCGPLSPVHLSVLNPPTPLPHAPLTFCSFSSSFSHS